MQEQPADLKTRRAAVARLLALSDWDETETLTETLLQHPHDVLRGPETGLVMLRGRMGSTGAPFNLGEATVTRCSVRLPDKTEGHAYALGRNGELVKRMALCDALLQSGGFDKALLDGLTKTLFENLERKRGIAAAKAATTKVDFFTVVRGDV